jgi:cysteine desulfurase
VIDSILPYFKSQFANPASIHLRGREIKKDIDKAKGKIAEIIGANSAEIIITSGATESINLAIKGLALESTSKRHLITAQTEHKAVLDCCKFLESIGFEIDYLPVDSEGLINLNELKSLIKDETLLVAIMWANNETGVIQNIKEIGSLVRDSNAFFMTDATQAVGKIKIDVELFNIDILLYIL